MSGVAVPQAAWVFAQTACQLHGALNGAIFALVYASHLRARIRACCAGPDLLTQRRGAWGLCDLEGPVSPLLNLRQAVQATPGSPSARTVGLV